MSFDEFEQAVCRMVKLDRNWTSDAPLPVRQKPLRYFARDTKMTVEDIYLIPGGRWLLASTSQSVTIWDLDAEVLDKPTATILQFNDSSSKSDLAVDSKDAPASANLLIVRMDG